MDQVKFVEDIFLKIWRDMVCIKQTLPFEMF